MNYTELKNAVKAYLECDEETFNTNYDLFVQLAEEDFHRQVQLPNLMQTATATFLANDRYLPLPSDYLSPYSLAVILPNGEYRMMVSKDHSFMREVYPDPNATDVPRFYAQFDNMTFLVGPTPDQNYPVEMNYFYMPASLTTLAPNGSTWVSLNCENAILFGTILQGYIYLKGDQDVIASYKEQYAQAIASMKIIAEGRDRKDSYRQSDNRLKV